MGWHVFWKRSESEGLVEAKETRRDGRNHLHELYDWKLRREVEQIEFTRLAELVIEWFQRFLIFLKFFTAEKIEVNWGIE